jgi:hypothetical protein
MAPLLTSRLTPLLTLAKIFGLNSSHSSTRSNKYLVLYSLALVVVYLTIFTLRILTSEREQIYTLNRVVTNLHLFCYIAIFFSDILSNWINSKSYCRALVRLEILDYQLRTVGYYPDCDKTRKMFYVSVTAASGLFLYVAIFDCLIDVFQTGEKIDFFFWLSIYLPITINYFSIFVIVFTFFLLNERYKCLEHLLNNISTRKLHMNVEQFTKFYLELTHISNSLVSQFSLQLSATFLFIFISITTNMYMVLKINLDLSQYILIFNFVLIHLGELVAVVLVSHWTTLRVSNQFILSFLFIQLLFRLKT